MNALLAMRVLNTPLMIHPQKLDAILSGIGGRLLGIDQDRFSLVGRTVELSPEMFSTRRGQSSDCGYQLVDGVAVIHACGVLVHRTRLNADSSPLLGYNDVATAIEQALASPNVRGVLLVLDSPGGEVQGAFELAERIYSHRGKKPIKAIADGLATSAAYLIGSACDEIAVTETAYVGSIGVVVRHVSFAGALQQDGIAVTQIFAGAHKVDGNPYEPLPPAVRSDIQMEVDGLYDLFVEAVAQHTGLGTDAIRQTEARSYYGQSAVAAGLASRVTKTDTLIAELSGSLPAAHPTRGSVRTALSAPSAGMDHQERKTMSSRHPPISKESAEVALAADIIRLYKGEPARQENRLTSIPHLVPASGISGFQSTSMPDGKAEEVLAANIIALFRSSRGL